MARPPPESTTATTLPRGMPEKYNRLGSNWRRNLASRILKPAHYLGMDTPAILVPPSAKSLSPRCLFGGLYTPSFLSELRAGSPVTSRAATSSLPMLLPLQSVESCRDTASARPGR